MKIKIYTKSEHMDNHNTPFTKEMLIMKKETLKAIINFIITVLTAIASAFCVQSCKG